MKNNIPQTRDDMRQQQHLHDEFKELKEVLFIQQLENVEFQLFEVCNHPFNLEQKREMQKYIED